MVRTAIVMLAAALGLAGTGCNALNGDDDNRPARGDERIGRGDRVDRGTEGRAGGRFEDPAYRSGVPRNAIRVREATGQSLSYRAEGDGVAYLFDPASKRILWSGSVRDGEELAVEPDRDRVLIGGRVVSDRNLGAGRKYEIYFDRGGRIDDRSYDRPYDDRRDNLR